MERIRWSTALAALCICASPSLFAQGAPDVVWEEATPSSLANSIVGVGWSAGLKARVALGSTDRWVRVRNPGNGNLIYSVLQPHRSGSANQTVFSRDGGLLAVHNSNSGLGYRVHRVADGVFLGTLAVTIDARELVQFAPDAQLSAALGGDTTMARWLVSDFTVVRTIGSGYDRVTTTFNFSPNGAYQSSASQGRISVQRRSDGSIVRALPGGSGTGFTPVAFTPDSTRIAAWASSPNRTTLWRIADGATLMQFPNAAAEEGVGAIRFTPDGARLVTSGYLPFVDSDGLWQQKGTLRFWRVADGAMRRLFDVRTGIDVTSPVAWSPDASQFVYGTYEGTAVAANTPAP
jgi:WD40 repeat protein